MTGTMTLCASELIPAALFEDWAAAFLEDESAALLGDRRVGRTATQLTAYRRMVTDGSRRLPPLPPLSLMPHLVWTRADRSPLCSPIPVTRTAPGPGTASVAGVVVRYPGRLQLDRSPGGVVHLRYRQAEPVPQAPEPFAAGPGDRLLQLPPFDGVSRAGGGASPGCRARWGRVARAFVICCWLSPVHDDLLGGLAGLPGIHVADLSLGSGGGVRHA